MGMTRKDQERKRELFQKLFGKPPHGDESLAGVDRREEVPEFLRLAAQSHKVFYHYTKLDSLLDMLKGGGCG